MKKPMITSTSNPLIKQARALRQKKARRENRLFLVEGIHHVGEVVEAGWDVETILYAPDKLTSGFAHELIERLPASSSFHSGKRGGIQPVTPQVMKSLTDKDNPQGILAVVRQKQSKLSDLVKPFSAIALVTAQDPGNVGTILRTMDAVGVETLFLLDGGVELYHPSVVRASMGTLFWKTVVQTSFDEFVSWSRDGQYQIIGTSAHGGVNYLEFSSHPHWILVLGNEQKGLSLEHMKACDVSVSLPMKGRVSSLNLAVAVGVLLYQFVKQK